MAKLVSSDLLKSFEVSKVACTSVKADYENLWYTHAERIHYLEMGTRDLNV